MEVGNLVMIDMEGLRNAKGRFAAAAFDPTLVAIQEVVVRGLADDLKEAYHDAAPYRPDVPGKPDHVHFQDSFATEVDQSVTLPYRFSVELDTSQADVAGYLKAGAYDISSPYGRTLEFWEYDGLVKIPFENPYGRAQPVHWFTKHERWEEDAENRIKPLLQDSVDKICGEVTVYLADGG